MKHTVHFKDVPANCHAASVLLHKVYTLMERKAWNKSRQSFIDIENKKHNGVLTCHYCHKTNLRKVTVDHIVAKSEGGNELSHTNFVVACERCNRKKGSKSADEFANSKYLVTKRK